MVKGKRYALRDRKGTRREIRRTKQNAPPEQETRANVPPNVDHEGTNIPRECDPRFFCLSARNIGHIAVILTAKASLSSSVPMIDATARRRAVVLL